MTAAFHHIMNLLRLTSVFFALLVLLSGVACTVQSTEVRAERTESTTSLNQPQAEVDRSCLSAELRDCRVYHHIDAGQVSCFGGQEVCLGEGWSPCMSDEDAEELAVELLGLGGASGDKAEERERQDRPEEPNGFH